MNDTVRVISGRLKLSDDAGLVQALHDSPAMVAVQVTGAFAGLDDLLWRVPGASRTILDFDLTYSRAATIEALGRDPGKFCTIETAVLMAEKAYERAVRLAAADREVIPFAPELYGLGATASLATDRVKKGADRFHVAVRSADQTWSFSATFEPGTTREEQAALADRFALHALLVAAGLEATMPDDYEGLIVTDHLRYLGDQARRWTIAPEVRHVDDELFEALLARPVIWPDGKRTPADVLFPDSEALLCGAFNPVHDGHLKMAEAVRTKAGRFPIFVLSIDHPDKGRLSIDEVERRIAQFAWKGTVLVTQGDGLFIEKARKFPGFAFVVGADTVRRLLDPKYYGGTAGRDLALEEFLALKTSFLVFDRQMPDGYVRLADLPIAERFQPLFRHVDGRWDVSSTELRARRAP